MRPYRHHRDIRGTHHSFGDAAHEKMVESASAVGPDDDHIGRSVLRRPDDLDIGDALTEPGRAVDAWTGLSRDKLIELLFYPAYQLTHNLGGHLEETVRQSVGRHLVNVYHVDFCAKLPGLLHLDDMLTDRDPPVALRPDILRRA